MHLVCEGQSFFDKQLETFNKIFQSNAKLIENQDSLFLNIDVNNGRINISRRFRLLVILFILYPNYQNSIKRLTLLALSIELNILNGNYRNVIYLLNLFDSEIESFINSEPNLNETIFIDYVISSFLSHELSHYAFKLDSNLRDKSINEVSQFIDEILKENNNFILKFAMRKIRSDEKKLEEFSCDKNAIKRFSEILNDSQLDAEEIKSAIIQLVRTIVSFQQFSDLKELAGFSIFSIKKLKQHIINHAFNVNRAFIGSMSLVEHLNSIPKSIVNDIVNEVYLHYNTLQNVFNNLFRDLNFASTLAYDKSHIISTDKQREINEYYFSLCDKLLKQFKRF